MQTTTTTIRGNRCANCGKGTQHGRHVTFSGKRNKRLFKPNLHAVWMQEGNQRLRKKLCTKCIRQYKAKVSAAATKVTQDKQVVQITA